MRMQNLAFVHMYTFRMKSTEGFIHEATRVFKMVCRTPRQGRRKGGGDWVVRTITVFLTQ